MKKACSRRTHPFASYVALLPGKGKDGERRGEDGTGRVGDEE